MCLSQHDRAKPADDIFSSDDYLSRPAAEEPGPSRYPGSFELAHDALGVTVSTNEAKRLETLSRDTLLSSRRLSLIVDLDQTIIHTTVDPTVGEWMNEIMEDEEEERRAKEEEEEKEKKDKAVEEGGEGDKSAVRSTTPPMSPPPKREKNPNAEALKDVARFQLADDLPPGAVKTKGRRPEPVRWYYTKPRWVTCETLARLTPQARTYQVSLVFERALRNARLYDGHTDIRGRHLPRHRPRGQDLWRSYLVA